MTKLEEIATAMAAYADALPETSRDAPFIRSHRIGLARAAVEAMREPTQAVLDAGPSEPYMDADVWGRMIDAILNEPEGSGDQLKAEG